MPSAITYIDVHSALKFLANALYVRELKSSSTCRIGADVFQRKKACVEDSQMSSCLLKAEEKETGKKGETCLY